MGRTIARCLALVALVIRSGAGLIGLISLIDQIGMETAAALRDDTCGHGGVPSRCSP
jgi:hypothetical protein